ncbi:MAG: nucleoside-triphosphatase, partial [Dehalococcoidia bacterium]
RNAVRALDVPAGGFYTEEVRARGRRQGFDLVTLDGRRTTLASVDSHGPVRVSKYGVELEALDGLGVPAVHSAITEARLIVIDEIGKMELYSEPFRQAVLAALDSGKPVLASIMLGPHPFADAVKRRQDVEVLAVTEENRARLAHYLLDRLRRLLD